MNEYLVKDQSRKDKQKKKWRKRMILDDTPVSPQIAATDISSDMTIHNTA